MSYSKLSPKELEEIEDNDLIQRYLDISKEIDVQKKAMDKSISEIEKVKTKIYRVKKKKEFETFIETMKNEKCMICREDLFLSAGTRQMAVSSYICGCSRPQIVHMGCMKTDFKCVCGLNSELDTRGSSGSKVRITVTDIPRMSSSWTGSPYAMDSDAFPSDDDLVGAISSIMRGRLPPL